MGQQAQRDRRRGLLLLALLAAQGLSGCARLTICPTLHELQTDCRTGCCWTPKQLCGRLRLGRWRQPPVEEPPQPPISKFHPVPARPVFEPDWQLTELQVLVGPDAPVPLLLPPPTSDGAPSDDALPEPPARWRTRSAAPLPADRPAPQGF